LITTRRMPKVVKSVLRLFAIFKKRQIVSLRLDDLSDDDLYHVLSQVSINDRIAWLTVNKRWSAVITSTFSNVTQLVVYSQHRVPSNYDSPNSYNIDTTKHSNFEQLLTRLNNLSEIDFRPANTVDENIRQTIAMKYPKLNVFKLTSCLGLSDNGLLDFGLFEQLRFVELRYANLTEQDLSDVITSCHLLETLDISGNEQVTGHCFAEFGPNIKELRCTCCRSVDLNGWQRLALGNGRQLKSINFDISGLMFEIEQKF